MIFNVVSKAAMQHILVSVDLHTNPRFINQTLYMKSFYVVVTTAYAVILQSYRTVRDYTAYNTFFAPLSASGQQSAADHWKKDRYILADPLILHQVLFEVFEYRFSLPRPLHNLTESAEY